MFFFKENLIIETDYLIILSRPNRSMLKQWSCIHSICARCYEFSIIKIMDMDELLVTRDTILETNSVSTATSLLTNLVACSSNVEKKRERRQ